MSESQSEKLPKPETLEDMWEDKMWDINKGLGGAYESLTPQQQENYALQANVIAEEIIARQNPELSTTLQRDLTYCFTLLADLRLADKVPALKALIGNF